MSAKELGFHKATRQKLRDELAVLAASRAKLSEVDALASAEKVLAEFETAESDAVTAWVTGGCGPARPVPDTTKHAELMTAVTAARRSSATCGPALEAIAASEQDIRDLLDANSQAIAVAAAHKMAEDYAVIGKRADALRAELRKLEARLEAGHFYWKNHADSYYQSHGKRQPAFDEPHTAAAAALPALEPCGQYAMPEREAIKIHADEFAALQEG
jgi:hypothetical protein